jgi:phosphonate transport system substrate-binding protein
MRNPFLRTAFRTLSFVGLSVLALGALGAGCKPAPADGAAATLYIAAIPDANKTELTEGYSKVAAHLSKELGVPVEYRPMTDYTAVVEAFKNDDVQLAWFGGVTGVQARRAVDGARAIAQGKKDPQFVSYFVANASTGIAPSETFPMAFAGRTFTFGPPTSTSGRVMPEYFLRQATGKSPQEFFGHPNRNTDGHDATALAVQEGAAEAGVLSSAKYDSMVAEGKLDPAKCVKIWTTPTYSDYNFTAHPSLDKKFGAGFTDRLQKALVGIQDPELLKVLLRPEGLIPARNEEYAALAECMASVGL